jgi:putative membrane protein
MGLLGAVLILELPPMVTLIGWRRTVARGQVPAIDRAGRLATISFIQAGLVVLMVFAAAAMARGLGMQ